MIHNSNQNGVELELFNVINVKEIVQRLKSNSMTFCRDHLTLIKSN